jgi:hypothetical protein
MSVMRPFRSERLEIASTLFTGLTGATLLILSILAVIIGNVLWHRLPMFLAVCDRRNGAGHVRRAEGRCPSLDYRHDRQVMLMTIFVLPVGVITAVYLTDARARLRCSHDSSAEQSAIWPGCRPLFSASLAWGFCLFRGRTN